jgi:DNA-binding response OmpR family regulator
MLTSFAARRGETNIPVSRGYALEAEEYIDKPITPKELLATVEKYLKK